MLDVAGRAKREESERRLRAKMGDLFDQLCPDARACLRGAEYTLLDEHWHLGPAQALVAMGAAFEAEVRKAFLERLTGFVTARDLHPFPKEKNVVTKDGDLRSGLTLEYVGAAMAREPQVWSEFCGSIGLNVERIRRAIRDVAGPRNKAAHEGTVPLISFASTATIGSTRSMEFLPR